MTNNFKKLADEAFQIHLQIRDQVKKLKEIKAELLKKMSEAKENKIVLDQGYIRLAKWKSDFSASLSKQFKKLEESKKNDLIKKGLIKLQYKLNTNEYQLVKNKNEKTDLDEFVIKRNNKVFLQFNTIDKSKTLEKRVRYSEDAEEYLQMNEEIVNELMEEIEPDPTYHEDDDPADIPDHEKEYKGYD